MNILFINSIGRDKFGGGEKWMASASIELARLGHEVVLGSKRNSKLLRYAAARGVRTAVFEIRGDFSPRTTIAIARYLKANAVDVMICNLNKDVRVAGLAARLYGRTAVLARHGMLLCSRKWKHKVTLKHLADGIITNSRTIRDAYAAYGWFDEEFVRVVYNGITIPEHVDKYDFSGRFPGKKIVYSAGRLSEQKGFTYLIEAAALLRRKRDDLVFVVSGEGKLEAQLKLQVEQAGLEDTFVFLGFSADIHPYLKGCDLFVLASLFEGMPNVVMEAMAMSRAVVATDVNGARELMQDGKTGLVVPPRNPEALAEGIERLIDSPDLLERFGQAGYERVRNEFSMSVMGTRLESLLQEKVMMMHKRNQS